MSRAKNDRASNKEELATAQGDLEVTTKDLAEDKLEAACAALEAAGPRYQAGDGDGVTIIERRRARRRVEEAA